MSSKIPIVHTWNNPDDPTTIKIDHVVADPQTLQSQRLLRLRLVRKSHQECGILLNRDELSVHMVRLLREARQIGCNVSDELIAQTHEALQQ